MGMPVPALVAATLGIGSPVSPFQTEDVWHRLALLFLAAEQTCPGVRLELQDVSPGLGLQGLYSKL